jgi:diguanylate cyclase (GGDEF)-like protein
MEVHDLREKAEVPDVCEISTEVVQVVLPVAPADKHSACLIQIYPTDRHLGSRYELGDQSLVIGRDPRCRICLEDDSVSRTHAHLIAREGEHYLTDHGTNGTFVNDNPALLHKLRNGDYVRVGRHIFRYLAGANIEMLYHEEIARLVVTDALTGLANRRRLTDILDRETSRAARYERPLSVLLLDIDYFRAVNNLFGRLIGDYVLRELAGRLIPLVRKEDLLARSSGEEFAAVLLECRAADAARVAERMRQSVEADPFLHGGGRIRIMVSIGIATAEKGRPLGGEDLLRQAENHLHQEKQKRRNRVV